MAYAISESRSPTLRPIWIISPIADLAFIILAPLAILPATWLLVQTVWTPETLFLATFCFASLGHHLPGYLRAYGDRELFARHRWRLIIAPPACLAVAFACLVWWPLRSFELLLMGWSTWHILMQTYGFLRIYDIRAGRDDRASARSDWFLCLLVFAAGFVFSDSRLFGLAEALWLAGLSVLDRAGLVALRWATGLALAVALLSAGWNAARQGRSVVECLGPKALLLATTGCFYWLIGGSTVSMLLAVAMFDVFHAVQYVAIVWAFNTRLARRPDRARAWLPPLFQQRWYCLAFYLAAIAAFGAAWLWLHGSDEQFAQRWGLALYSASAMLHFYTDGFIWRVSQPSTRAPLAEGADAPTRQINEVGSWQPAASWAATFGLLIGLGWWEMRQVPTSADQDALLRYLTDLTPDVPELQVRSSQAALAAGDPAAALDLARSAASRRPRSYAARLQLGAVLATNEQWEEAAEELTAAQQLRPDSAMIADAWGEYHVRRGQPSEAVPHYRRALAGFGAAPAAATTRLALCRALIASGQTKEAVMAAQEWVSQRPQSPDAVLELGDALAADGQYKMAIDSYQRALTLRPDAEVTLARLGKIHFQLGLTQLAARDLSAAEASFRRCTEFTPKFEGAYCNLGAIYFDQGRGDDARLAYLQALRINPDHPAANYNLGLVYLAEGRIAVAHQYISRAAKLGQAPTTDVAQALGL
jgi:tetratricopeptide (TPR) repeat protein